ncbi:MAG: DUF2784 domain-containing protein [Gammaproteobacteria bacterium]|nr:MAG: DUF2784 domain-containing protein [Gammaproteobacteria bacterium]
MTLLADLVLIAHLLFIIFVIFGGLIVLKWHRAMWLHIPCAIWGALIEFFGWICPLTYLENYFRQLGNGGSYEGGFIQHYLMPIIYPQGLTTGIQILLGVIVAVINLVIYYFVWRYWYDKHTK